MARLIDADALLHDMGLDDMTEADGYKMDLMRSDIRDAINDAPTVDAVEVVRCKDCEFFRPQAGWDGGQCSYLEDRFDLFEVLMFDDDYCSDGERKER